MAIIQADPNKDRIDAIITRWLKRHLQRLGAEVNLDQLNSLVEDRDMLAENLENWAQKERAEGRVETQRETAHNLIARTEMDDRMISEITGLPIQDVARLRRESQH
ncbi:hypothetical protein HLV40_13445 [Chromohalobacter salexigens]|nr:hypothetical protein [Chromohalobacter salexigens]